MISVRWIFLLLFILFIPVSVSAIAGDQWHLVNQSIGTGFDFGFVEFKDKLWLISGNDIADPDFYGSNKTWYSEDGNIWVVANATPEFPSRSYSNLVVCDNKLWVIGGWWIDEEDNWIYPMDAWWSDDGEIWYLANASIMAPRDGAAIFSYNNKLWLIGGVDPTEYTYPFADVWSSDDGIIWSIVTDAPTFGDRASMGSLVFDNKMWIIGGWKFDPVVYSISMDDIWYSTDGITWIQGDAHVYPLFLDSGVVAPYPSDSKVLIQIPSSGIWYSDNMVAWTNVNISPQYNTFDFTEFGSPYIQAYISGMTEFKDRMYIYISGAQERSPTRQGYTPLGSIWYTDNLELPLPTCSGSLSTSSIVTSASAGIVILVMGLIVITGFVLISLISKAGGES